MALKVKPIMPNDAAKFNPEVLKRVRYAKKMTQGEAAASIGISKRSLAGFETGERVPTGATLALIETWIKPPTEGALFGAASSSDLADLQEQYDNLKDRLRREYQDRLCWLDRIDELEKENQRLKNQVHGLPVQAANQALSYEEARLVRDVGDALRVPPNLGLVGVLEQVRANLASVGALSPPTEHEPDIETKGEGGQGGTTKKRRRGTSST